MINSKISLLLSLLIFPIQTIAKPAYLNCLISSEKSKLEFHVRLDEDTGKVTHTNADGSAYNVVGFFTASAISYQYSSVVGGIKLLFKHEIDRATLKVKRDFLAEPLEVEFRSKIPAINESLNGECIIQEVQGNKI